MSTTAPIARDLRVVQIGGLTIATDRLDYSQPDQVLPLFDEQRFFLDELPHAALGGAHALEIGVGSGVLSIAVARAGAARVTALDINPRAMRLAAINIDRNCVADRVELELGDPAIYRPVSGRRFDFVFSNPPFMPSPPGFLCHWHSDAGPLGLDFVDALLHGLDEHLTDGGRAQIVTAAPGGAEGPSHLLELIRRHWKGAARVVVSPLTVPFSQCMGRLSANPEAAAETDALRRYAARQGATHLYLCVVHCRRAPGSIDIVQSARRYNMDRLLPATEMPR